MKRFVEGEDRRQGVLLPEFLDDYVSEENPVSTIASRRLRWAGLRWTVAPVRIPQTRTTPRRAESQTGLLCPDQSTSETVCHFKSRSQTRSPTVRNRGTDPRNHDAIGHFVSSVSDRVCPAALKSVPSFRTHIHLAIGCGGAGCGDPARRQPGAATSLPLPPLPT